MTTAATDPALLTVAEQSGFKKTGRYAEAERLCAELAKRWPDAVRCFEFGRSPEGRPLLALIVSRTGALDAATLKQRGTPLLMLQGGIHPGESDGKDAGFIMLRDWLTNPASPGNPLGRIAILFVPVFNVDGHERFGAWNRPNQIGPEEMGWRTTAQNLNLNRDYCKADSPEMQAMLRLMSEWDPLVFADLHVTDGADFEPDISITGAPILEGDERLHAAATALRDGINAHLEKNGSIPLDFYPTLERQDDPASGFAVSPQPGRYSTGYWALRNRLAILVETHSWKDYDTRVRATRHTLQALADRTVAHGAEWLAQVRAVDADPLACKPVVLDIEVDTHTITIPFRGYAYTREPSAISGGLVTRYDPKTPQIWNIPFRDRVRTTLEMDPPKGGYFVAAGFAAAIAERLAAHGVQFSTLKAGVAKAEVQVFRASKVVHAPGTFEGRGMVTVEGEWKPEARELAPGSLFVPIAQPQARLVMALLEPMAPDSFTSWGLFNAVFEQKEYIEPYAMEPLARQMLAADPALAAEFYRKLDTDAAFAGDANARLEFFYRRHSSWDERYGLVPVYRSDAVSVK